MTTNESCIRCGEITETLSAESTCASCLQFVNAANETAWQTVLNLQAGKTPTKEDLERVMRPVARPVTAIAFREVTDPESLPVIGSHYGGHPYFEKGEEWPQCGECENALSFIGQIDYRKGWHARRNERALLCFSFCWICGLEHRPLLFPYDEGPNNWQLKEYCAAAEEKAVRVEPPGKLRFITHPLAIDIRQAISLPPSWEVKSHHPTIEAIMERLNSESPWEVYRQVAEELGAVSPYDTFLGGYPVSDDLVPECEECDTKMDLLFKLGDEEVTKFPFLDGGAFAFYSCKRHPGTIRFRPKMKLI